MIDHEEAIHNRSNGTYGGSEPLVLPDRDVRRKRPPLLMFLLRRETLRRLLRVAALLALDFVGVSAALFTAIVVKLAVKGGLSAHVAWGDTRPSLAFAYLIT